MNAIYKNLPINTFNGLTKFNNTQPLPPPPHQRFEHYNTVIWFNFWLEEGILVSKTNGFIKSDNTFKTQKQSVESVKR